MAGVIEAPKGRPRGELWTFAEAWESLRSCESRPGSECPGRPSSDPAQALGKEALAYLRDGDGGSRARQRTVRAG